jgi:hypothetical protein
VEVIMSNRIKLIAVAAALIGGIAPAALAAGPRYEVRRLPNGPRPDRYVFVRVGEAPRAAAPYALTGPRRVQVKRSVAQRWAGSRYVGAAWTTDYVVE